MINSKKLSAAVLCLAMSAAAEGADMPMSVNSANMGDTVNVAASSGITARSAQSEVTVRLNNSCFPTNLRGVANPLAATSIVDAEFTLNLGGKDHDFKVSYPAAIVGSAGLVSNSPSSMSPSRFEISGGGSAAIFGNTVILKTKIPKFVSVDASGQVKVASSGDVSIKGTPIFRQTVNCDEDPALYASFGHKDYKPSQKCGEFMGKTGDLTATFGGISVSSDRSVIDVNIAFPGENGFCGGFYSPLMLFFNKARPKFNNESSFPLNPSKKTAWPEENAPGWFLAFDRDQSGRIDQKNELFGEGESAANGFEDLKKSDANRDDKIDRRDPDFERMVLWNDKNGDGISQNHEMEKLSRRVKSISLKYEKRSVRPIGRDAEAREKSVFWYSGKGLKLIKGEVLDIWLAPK